MSTDGFPSSTTNEGNEGNIPTYPSAVNEEMKGANAEAKRISATLCDIADVLDPSHFFEIVPLESATSISCSEGQFSSSLSSTPTLSTAPSTQSKDFERLARYLQVVNLQPDDAAFQQGCVSAYAAIVLYGQVSVRDASTGEEVATLGKGKVVGPVGFFERSAIRTADVFGGPPLHGANVIQEDATGKGYTSSLAVFHYDVIDELATIDPEIYVKFVRLLAGHALESTRVITAHQTTLRLQKELEAPPGLQGDGSDLSKTPRTAREEDNVEEESSSQALNEKRKPVGTPKKGSVSAARKGPEVTKVAVAAVKGAFKLNVTIGASDKDAKGGSSKKAVLDNVATVDSLLADPVHSTKSPEAKTDFLSSTDLSRIEKVDPVLKQVVEDAMSKYKLLIKKEVDQGKENLGKLRKAIEVAVGEKNAKANAFDKLQKRYDELLEKFSTQQRDLENYKWKQGEEDKMFIPKKKYNEMQHTEELLSKEIKQLQKAVETAYMRLDKEKLMLEEKHQREISAKEAIIESLNKDKDVKHNEFLAQTRKFNNAIDLHQAELTNRDQEKEKLVVEYDKRLDMHRAEADQFHTKRMELLNLNRQAKEDTDEIKANYEKLIYTLKDQSDEVLDIAYRKTSSLESANANLRVSLRCVRIVLKQITVRFFTLNCLGKYRMRIMNDVLRLLLKRVYPLLEDDEDQDLLSTEVGEYSRLFKGKRSSIATDREEKALGLVGLTHKMFEYFSLLEPAITHICHKYITYKDNIRDSFSRTNSLTNRIIKLEDELQQHHASNERALREVARLRQVNATTEQQVSVLKNYLIDFFAKYFGKALNPSTFISMIVEEEIARLSVEDEKPANLYYHRLLHQPKPPPRVLFGPEEPCGQPAFQDPPVFRAALRNTESKRQLIGAGARTDVGARPQAGDVPEHHAFFLTSPAASTSAPFIPSASSSRLSLDLPPSSAPSTLPLLQASNLTAAEGPSQGPSLARVSSPSSPASPFIFISRPSGRRVAKGTRDKK